MFVGKLCKEKYSSLEIPTNSTFAEMNFLSEPQPRSLLGLLLHTGDFSVA
jgi:hypothetical protein